MSGCHKCLSFHQLNGQEDWLQLVCLAQKQAVSMDLHSSKDILIHELAMALSKTPAVYLPGEQGDVISKMWSCLHS